MATSDETTSGQPPTLPYPDADASSSDGGEQARLRALRGYEILDTPDEPTFDRLVELARAMFGTPIAEVSLIDENRQWLKARVPDGPREAPRDWSFCTTTIQGDGVMVVPDARADPRLRDSPFVTGRPFIRFYAGAPLRTPDGHKLGTLCVVSPEPRERFDEGDRSRLQNLADIVMDEFELRRRRRGETELVTRFLETSSDCIKVLGLDGALEFMNRPGQTAMEVDDFDACQGRAWPALMEEPARAQAEAALAEGRAGRTARFEAEVATLKGTPRWWDVTVSPILGADGRPERLLAISRDVTERRLAEATLRESEERFRNVADHAPVMMWVTDPDGACTYLNRTWHEFTGQTPEEAQGLGWLHATHPDDTAEAGRVFLAANARREPFRLEYRLRRADGAYRWAIDAAAPRFGPGYEFLGYVGSVTDIHERKEAEEALEQRVAEAVAEREQAEAALRQAQKMEAVGQLTGGLAHDFNNLLAGISGSLELMSSRLAQGRLAEVERYVAAAQGAARRAAALTHRLLAFSRRQTLDPRPTDVNRLVAGLEELIRRTVGPAVAVEVVGASGLWPTLVDPHQLENALLNLCINARDAMPEGGRITVETANKWLDRAAARRQDLPEGQYVSLCVTDTGTGMTPEVRARAFDPFFTTKPLGEGTGLGLSMIYGFARQSGGQVRLYSEVGQGTTACIYLPRHLGEDQAEEDEARVAEAQAPSEQGETVLVVDDEPTVRMLVADVLGELGYGVIEAADGAEGLKVLRSDARVDLLVTDVGLPGGMNGRQMADAGREVRPDLRVLFITGYASNAAVGNGQLAPGMAVLTKPFAMDELAVRVGEMTARREKG